MAATSATRRSPPSGEQGDDRDQPDDQHHPAQPGQPVRAAAEQDERPRRGDRRRVAASTIRGPAARRAGARAPTAPIRDQRCDRGRQRHGVVRVDDALHEAEHQPGDQQPAAPEQYRPPGAGRSVGAGAERPATPTSRISAAGSSQAIWPPTDGVEQPAACRRAAPAAPPPPHRRPPTSSPVSRPEPVVAEGQLQHAVRLRAADVGPVASPATARPVRPTSPRRPAWPARRAAAASSRGAAGRRRDQVDQRERRQHQERLQHLGQEREPDDAAASSSQPVLAAPAPGSSP